MMFLRLHARVAIATLVTIMTFESVAAAPSVLTGRWGDTRVPQQLVCDYETKQTQALVVVSFSTICPLAKRLVPTLNQLQEEYNADGIQLIALFPQRDGRPAGDR